MLLKEYLEETKIPLEQFAKLVGISPRTLYSILNGFHDSRLSIAVKIEEITHTNRKKGVTCKELLIPYYERQDAALKQAKPNKKKTDKTAYNKK